jgi:hypothetical protein
MWREEFESLAGGHHLRTAIITGVSVWSTKSQVVAPRKLRGF